MWRKHKIQTSFKTLVSKKKDHMAVEKVSLKQQTFRKNNIFQLSHGTKHIHQSKMHLQHTHRRKIFCSCYFWSFVRHLDSGRLKTFWVEVAQKRVITTLV